MGKNGTANSGNRRASGAGERAGGETPERRFRGMKLRPGYETKGDIDRPPFEGHPDHEDDKARPNRESRGAHREADTAGQHGQRPSHRPAKDGA